MPRIIRRRRLGQRLPLPKFAPRTLPTAGSTSRPVFCPALAELTRHEYFGTTQMGVDLQRQIRLLATGMSVSICSRPADSSVGQFWRSRSRRRPAFSRYAVPRISDCKWPSGVEAIAEDHAVGLVPRFGRSGRSGTCGCVKILRAGEIVHRIFQLSAPSLPSTFCTCDMTAPSRFCFGGCSKPQSHSRS